jgi:hypothetical protein
MAFWTFHARSPQVRVESEYLAPGRRMGSQMGPYMGSLGTEEVHCGLRNAGLILAVRDLRIYIRTGAGLILLVAGEVLVGLETWDGLHAQR